MVQGLSGPRSDTTVVDINGQKFALAGAVQMQRLAVDSPPFRTQGTQSRADNAKVNKLIYDDWAEMGMGWARMRRETGRGVGGMKNSTLETRFSSQITLPLLATTTSHAAPADHLVKFLNWNSNVWGFFEEEYAAGSTTRLLSYKFSGSGDSWGAGGTIVTSGGNAEGARLVDVTEFSNDGVSTLYALITAISSGGDSGPGEWSLYASTDGASWSVATNIPGAGANDKINEARMNNSGGFKDDLGKIISDGTNLLAAVWESATTIKVWTSTDPDDTAFTAVDTLPSTNGPKALVMWRDIRNITLNAPYLITSDNVYLINVSGTSLIPILPVGMLPGSPDTGRGAAVASDGNLYIPHPQGDILQLSMPANGSVIVRNVGPGSKATFRDADGLVTARQGFANFIFGGSPRWLYAAYGGNASSKTASVLAMDYITGAWHSVYSDATANRDMNAIIISNEDDATPRLHAASEGAAASVLIQLEQPEDNPSTGVVLAHQTSGEVEWAEDDLFDPHADSAVLTSRVDVTGLTDATGATTVFIEHEYGLNGTGATTVSNFGNFITGDKVLEFGRTSQNDGSADAGTPIGVSAKVMRNNLKFTGAADQTPVMKEFQLETRLKTQLLWQFIVPIDIHATADVTGESAEAIWARIDTILDTVPLVPFIFGEDGSGSPKTYYVEAVSPTQGSADLEAPDSIGLGAKLEQTARGGTMNLVLEEVV